MRVITAVTSTGFSTDDEPQARTAALACFYAEYPAMVFLRTSILQCSPEDQGSGGDASDDRHCRARAGSCRHSCRQHNFRDLIGDEISSFEIFDTGVKRLITEGSRRCGDDNRAHIILDRASQNDR